MRAARMGRRLNAFLALGAILAALAPAGWAASGLGKLNCVRLGAEDPGGEGKSIGITREELVDALLVNVKARLPRVPVASSCFNLVEAVVVLDRTTTSAGRGPAYFGAVMLRVRRMAVVLDTNEAGHLTAWEGALALAGPAGRAKPHVLEALDSLITQFATDYYQAGNP